MEGFKSMSLINKDYEKVMDIIAKPLKSTKEVKKNRDKVMRLIFGLLSIDEESKSRVLDGYQFIWEVMPDEILDVYTIDKLNQRIAQFSQYVLSVESEYEDHGFSLLVSYYITACGKYLIINKK